jgi:phosphoribosyl 1,2-cyclic phosphodiesterase/ActR/RegA family two-component response regulator
MEKIVLVDDDADIRRVVELRLRLAGFQVLTASDGETGLQLIRAENPRLVLLDLMMPRKHGFAVCQEIRSDPDLRGTYIIVGSAKTYAPDIKKAKELGADLYLTKPYDLEALVGTIKKALASSEVPLKVRFWGTRGSIATPGPATLRYGGNTSCTEVRCGDSVLLLDCGTGAREAGLALGREFQRRPLHVHIFVGHTHWDHIQGFPFFVPAYVCGNRVSIYSLRGSDKSLEKVFTGQMDASYFPVDLTDLKSQLQFIELEGPVEIGEARVSHVYLNHPGLAVGFRIDFGAKSVVYISDHEPYCRLSGDNDHNRKLDREIDAFAREADLYVREAQYTEEEYPSKRGWGHSTWKDALESAHAANARRLALFHHDPMRDDETLDGILASCRAYMQERGMMYECIAAAENLELTL